MARDLFTPTLFWRALISDLVLNGERSIQPKSAADRSGFASLIEALGSSAAELKSSERREWYRTIVRLRNYLNASNNGAFDNIESELRELQTSSVMLPNPDYEDITLQLSPPFAKSILNGLDTYQRELVQRAGEAYRSAKRTYSSETIP